MKSLLSALVFLVLCSSVNGQLQEDKKKHYVAGSAIGFWASSMTVNQKPIISLAWSIGSAAFVGISKEVVYDKWMENGTPEVEDALWTVAGGITGFAMVQGFKWFCNRIEKWKYRRLQPRL